MVRFHGDLIRTEGRNPTPFQTWFIPLLGRWSYQVFSCQEKCRSNMENPMDRLTASRNPSTVASRKFSASASCERVWGLLQNFSQNGPRKWGNDGSSKNCEKNIVYFTNLIFWHLRMISLIHQWSPVRENSEVVTIYPERLLNILLFTLPSGN